MLFPSNNQKRIIAAGDPLFCFSSLKFSESNIKKSDIVMDENTFRFLSSYITANKELIAYSVQQVMTRCC